MKRLLLSILAGLLMINCQAQGSGIGLGVIAGEPTGLSAKMWTGEKSAIDAALAWSFVGRGYMHTHADILVHNYSIDVDQGKLPLYFGIGAKLDLASNLGLGVRVPFGIAYLVDSAPIDIFIELVPVFNLIPATTLSMEGGIGIRYFF